MTQLSPVGKKALSHITSIIVALERAILYGKHFLLRKCPEFVKNIHTIFVTLKDLASFVPSIVYKTLLCIAVLSVLLRKLKKWREGRLAVLEKQEKGGIISTPQNNLENLGPEYLVNSNAGKSLVGNARTEIDSFYLQFQQFDDSRPKDFRDVVFFELMRSYRAVEERERE